MAFSFRSAAQESHCPDLLEFVSFCCRMVMIPSDRLADLAELILFERQKHTTLELVDPKLLALVPY